MEKLNAENVYCIGDTHTLAFVSLLIHFKLKDFILIHVGDAGEGFSKNIEFKVDNIYLDNLEDYCERHNGRILIVRGNHSNPEYYTDSHWTREKYKRVTFVKDYTYLSINDNTFLFAGGAVSIDRNARFINHDYWADEGFNLPDNYTDLSVCDVLITHSVTIDAPPIGGLDRIAGWFKNDPSLRYELIEEREKIKKLVDQVKPKINLYGHFHNTYSERIEGTWFRGLDINELLDITRDL